MIQESLRSLTKRISELGSVHESKLAFGLVMHLVLLCSKYYFKVYHSEFLLAYDRRSNGRTDVSAVSDRNEDRDETNKNQQKPRNNRKKREAGLIVLPRKNIRYPARDLPRGLPMFIR